GGWGGRGPPPPIRLQRGSGGGLGSWVRWIGVRSWRRILDVASEKKKSVRVERAPLWCERAYASFHQAAQPLAVIAARVQPGAVPYPYPILSMAPAQH